jgi:hypothetical protein
MGLGPLHTGINTSNPHSSLLIPSPPPTTQPTNPCPPLCLSLFLPCTRFHHACSAHVQRGKFSTITVPPPAVPCSRHTHTRTHASANTHSAHALRPAVNNTCAPGCLGRCHAPMHHALTDSASKQDLRSNSGSPPQNQLALQLLLLLPQLCCSTTVATCAYSNNSSPACTPVWRSGSDVVAQPKIHQGIPNASLAYDLHGKNGGCAACCALGPSRSAAAGCTPVCGAARRHCHVLCVFARLPVCLCVCSSCKCSGGAVGEAQRGAPAPMLAILPHRPHTHIQCRFSAGVPQPPHRSPSLPAHG